MITMRPVETSVAVGLGILIMKGASDSSKSAKRRKRSTSKKSLKSTKRRRNKLKAPLMPITTSWMSLTSGRSSSAVIK